MEAVMSLEELHHLPIYIHDLSALLRHSGLITHVMIISHML